MNDPAGHGDVVVGPRESAAPWPAEGPEVRPELLRVAAKGLEGRPADRKRVVIVGAGIAGLVAGFELTRQGHEPIILEAQNRVGGRIYTLRDFAPGLYAEAGAMRIPRVHQLTLEYCRLFGLTVRPFVMDNQRAPVYLAGRRMTLEQLNNDPDLIPFELSPAERGRTDRKSVV